jgi:hypothetical protein
MRWFLVDGFGQAPQYGTAPAAFAADQASFLLPCFTPRDLDIVVALESEAPLTVAVSANGTRVGGGDLEPARVSRLVVRAPARTLFRGDNVMTLTRLGSGGGPVRLHGVTVRPVR